ncbi:hypothetical protein [Modestobacter sp. SSW1-42]|uniref:hypothetical protein n=1 Tax=Modestobacter sp. SSW1-42 TaxID=596372 RepID=UPI003986FC5F
MRKTLVMTIAATAALTTACSGSGDDTTAAPATVTQTVAVPAPATSAAQPSPAPVAVEVTSAAPSSAAVVVDFAMPDMVGTNLQVAQNTMQTNNVFYSVSHDLLGTRNQVMDGNWQVCDQNVPAGQRVTGDVEGAIDFGVVKLEETCP